MNLAPLDIGLIALYVAAVLALGFSAKLRDNSLLQYLAAGRNLSLPAFVATLVSTWYGGILAIGDSVKEFGLGSLLLMGAPYYLFAIVYALWLAPRVRGADQISIPERIALRFGKRAGVVGAVLIFLLAVPAPHVLMLGVMVQQFTAWSLPLCIVVACIGGTLFLYRGGLLADVRAGLLAFAGMYVGFVVMVSWAVGHYPLDWLLHRLAHVDHAPGVVVNSWTGGKGWLVVISFFILGAWTLVDPGFHQRVASAASPALGKRGVLVCVAFWFLFDLLSITTGLYAMALLPSSASGLTLFPQLADRLLPPGLKAIFVCGVTGTILSAVVGYTLISGATFGREIVGRIRSDLTNDQVKAWTRIGIGVTCVAAIALALRFQDQNIVFDYWYLYSGAVVGALLLPVSFAYSREKKLRCGGHWVATSMALAFLVSFAWMVCGKRTGNNSLEVYLAGQNFSLGTLVPGLIVSALVLGLGEVVGRRGNTHA